MCGDSPALLIAAARRWHERYRAVPTVIGLATGFEVGRPPTDLADAERLAIEHQVFAGRTAGTTERAYARAPAGTQPLDPVRPAVTAPRTTVKAFKHADEC